MGLDCYVLNGGEGGRIGSYLAVHTLRSLFIQAGIDYCRKKIINNYKNLFFECIMESDLSKKYGNIPSNILKKILGYIKLDNDLINKLKNGFLEELEEDNYHYNIIQSYQELIGWIKPMNDRKWPNIEYENFPDDGHQELSYLHSLIYTGLIGIYKFVNHSDSDGYFSYGDCCDIVLAMKKVEKYIDSEFLEWFQIVKSYYQSAIDKKSVLVYC